MKKKYNLFSWHKARKIFAGLSFVLLGTFSYGQINTFPHVEGFDGGAIPSGWTQVQETGTRDWTVVTNGAGAASITAPNSGTHNAKFVSTAGGGVTKLVTPTFDLTGLTTPQLTFYYGQEVWAGDQNQLKIYYSGDDGATWTQLQHYTSSVSSWTEVSMVLPNPSATYKIAFEGINSYGRANVLDDIRIAEAPSCLKPTDVTISNLTTTSATVSWTVPTPAPANGYEYYYSTDSTAPTASTTASGTSTTTSANLTGLSVSTTYYVWVRSVCSASENSEWTSVVSLYTNYCQPSSTGNGTYVNDFSTSGGTQNIAVTGSGFATGGYIDNSSMFVETYAGGDFSFNAAIVGGTAGFSIWVDWNNDLVFDNATEKVFNTTGYGNGPFTGTISVPSGTAVGNYRMRITTDYNLSNPNLPCAARTRAEFEDYTITVGAAPSCVKPSDVTSSNVTATSVDVSWTAPTNAPANGYEYYYSTDATAPTASTAASGTSTTTSANLTGLSASTTYYVWVRSVCSASDKSEWSLQGTFTTECEAFTTEYCENFDSATAGSSTNPTTPDCWSFIDGGAGYGYVSSFSANSGANCFYMYNSSDTTGNYMLISPNTTSLSDGNHRIKFMVDGSSGYELIVGTMSDPTDASTFTAVSTVTLASSNYEEHIVDIPSGTNTYFAIKHGLGGTYRTIRIDDVCFEEIPSCVKPSDVTSSNITTTSATVSWTAPASVPANGYEYYYSTDATAPTASTTASGTSTTTSANLTGLSSSTAYYVWVRSVCSASDKSVWSLQGTFATLCAASEVPNYANNLSNLNCWTQGSGGDENSGPTTTGSSAWTADTFLNDGSTPAMKFNAYSTARIAWLMTPVFDLSGGGNYQLFLHYGLTRWNATTADNLGSDDQIKILMSEDGGSTWTVVKTWTAADNVSNTDNPYVYQINSTSANVKFAFYGTDGTVDDSNDVEFFISDFKINNSTLATNEVNVKDLKGVQIYPNPFQDVVNISDIKGVEKISIIDMSGRVVETFAPANSLNLSGLNGGMYLINLSYEDGSVKTLKAIKK